ncbi:MAG: tRNA (adenosine(37)-N6)-threonylcarbamoyltransferase complex ATPase subunit type 1 TsaE [Bacteroidetes bacterium]|nr:MAG: tRNA (adenosine(37)-N6)-threonylcarbamoyltransferase complex ATPase subunit type 1 TsaE [Bacteroidota bacterium]
MAEEFESFTENQLGEVAQKLLKLNPDSRIFAFYGAMGAGKTTLIKAICNQLDVTDTVGSPTFSIINQYLTRHGENLYHFDFYRMNKLEEAYDIGYEDYFFSGNYCFIEWPEKIETLLPEGCCRVYLKEEDGLRYISFEKEKSEV